jgi:peptidoglycan hydrolase FlgJ
MTALASPAAISAAIGRAGIPGKPPVTLHEKARAAAQEFEAVFLNAMFSEMFTAIDGEGLFGGGPGAGVWRSFLTDEYAKSFARSGGIGIADDVYRTLLAQQEARSGVQPAIATR